MNYTISLEYGSVIRLDCQEVPQVKGPRRIKICDECYLNMDNNVRSIVDSNGAIIWGDVPAVVPTPEIPAEPSSPTEPEPQPEE